MPEDKELKALLEEVRSVRAVFEAEIRNIRKKQNVAVERLIGSADKKKIAKIKRLLETL